MNDWIDGVIRDVSELPDRSSPDGQPEMMLVSAEELRRILERAKAYAPLWRPIGTAPPRDRVLLWNDETQDVVIGWKPADSPSDERRRPHFHFTGALNRDRKA